MLGSLLMPAAAAVQGAQAGLEAKAPWLRAAGWLLVAGVVVWCAGGRGRK